MKTESKIKKGKRFEDFVAGAIKDSGLGNARREIGSGSGKRKGDIFANLPFLLECKNQKHIKWWESIDQAKEQARIGNFSESKWALIVRDPRSPEVNPEVYAVIDMWQLFLLLKKEAEPKIKKGDREFKFKVERLMNSAKAVLKELKDE